MFQARVQAAPHHGHQGQGASAHQHGNSSSQEPIGRLRGRVHRYQGVPVVVTYHPAYLLRQLPEKAKAWDDLRLALKVHARVRRLEAEAAAGQAPSA